MPGDRRWYLVQAKTGLETRARAHLERQQFEVFLPTILRTVRHARRSETKKVPLFPGYLFVALDLHEDHWGAVSNTVGVIRLVIADGRPLPVPRGIVECLLERDTDKGLDLAKGNLVAGSKVRVLSGPFADQLAHVERMAGPERVRILLDLMGNHVPIEVEVPHLLPIAPAR